MGVHAHEWFGTAKPLETVTVAWQQQQQQQQ
jgi:hypothetical protein